MIAWMRNAWAAFAAWWDRPVVIRGDAFVPLGTATVMVAVSIMVTTYFVGEAQALRERIDRILLMQGEAANAELERQMDEIRRQAEQEGRIDVLRRRIERLEGGGIAHPPK